MASPAYPAPDPAIEAPVGVHGSLKRVLRAKLHDPAVRLGAPEPKAVTFHQRPTQLGQYPAVNIVSEGTADVTYGGGGTKKYKAYRVTIEVYGVSLSDAELLGEAVERALETGGPDDRGSAVRQIASLTAADPDATEILDEGNEKYALEPDRGPGVERTHRGELHYRVGIARSFGG